MLSPFQKITPGDSYSFFFSGGFGLFFIAWIEVKGTRTSLRSDVEYYLLKHFWSFDRPSRHLLVITVFLPGWKLVYFSSCS